MLNDRYYYNATVKKTVALFGTMFNSIYISKTAGGKSTGIQRVPLAYGPRQKFLGRIQTNDAENQTDVAIKLPRLSFEITSISPDQTPKLNPLNSQITLLEDGSRALTRQSVPYIINFQLSIYGRQLDDVLQIFEQIVPIFNPEFTISARNFEGPGTVTDIPITLQSVSPSDDYEGDFQTRRITVYTLDFAVKVKFSTGASTVSNYIQFTTVEINGLDGEKYDQVRVNLENPETDTPDDYSVETIFGFDE